MFAKKKDAETPLDKVIEDATRWLDPNSADYMKSIEALERLYKLKKQETESRISPDTKLIVAANLAGILMILIYERANVLTSKAMNSIMKMR
jgi:hypothetical protein